MGICSVVGCFSDAVYKISVCDVAVISNLTVCYDCVFHAVRCRGFFFDWVMQCLLISFAVFRPPSKSLWLQICFAVKNA